MSSDSYPYKNNGIFVIKKRIESFLPIKKIKIENTILISNIKDRINNDLGICRV